MTRPIDRLLRLRVLVVATTMAFAAPALAGRLNASAVKVGGSYDQFIVRFNKGTPEFDNATARQRLFDSVGGGNGVGISQLRRLAVGADVIKASRRLDSIAARQLMGRLAKSPHVDYVELDAIRKRAFTPNDTSYASQWHYFEATAGIRAPAAWDHATGSGVVVAVIDTGITPHSDLSANVIAGYDFITNGNGIDSRDGNDRDANPNDEGDWTTAGDCGDSASHAANSSWHGTHVAGTIAAVTNNSKGVAGVAFNAKVEPLRVLGRCGGSTSDIADAIVWASGGAVSGVPANANPAEVINMSLGGPGACDFTSQAAIDTAVANGTVVVVAAGNDGADASGFSPASCDNVITVAALTRFDTLAGYSNFGSAVDLSAPGGDGIGGSDVLSTINKGTTTQGAEGYATYAGTSMATPHVAGTLALMQSVHVNTPAFLEAIVKKTARVITGTCVGCGAGEVDANAAVLAAATPALMISDVKVSEGRSGTKLATFTVQLSQSIGSNVTFDVATADGTAIAGSDYVANSLSGQSIPAGQTSKTFSVIINGDSTIESDETFLVNLSNVVATGVTLADVQAQGTILNDDGIVLTKGVSASVPDTSAGQQILYQLDVLPGASNLNFNTSGGSGDADIYVSFGTPPTVSNFQCASTSATTTEHCGFASPQAGTYYVLVDAFADISGVSLVGSYSGGTPLPTLSIGDVSISEGNSGTKVATFTVSLSATSTSAVTYDIATANNSATAGSDYVASSLVGESIPAGQPSKTFAVTINGDTAVEADESFFVNVGNVAGATVADGQALGTISNDDAAALPTLSINDVSIAEGNSGTRLMTFTVSLSAVSGSDVTYDIATNTGAGNATAGSDYVAKSLVGETIPAGQPSKTFTVTINGDTTVEADESFNVNLSNAAGATIADSQSIATITNDDTPTLSIADVSITEGNSGTQLMTFTATLSQVSLSNVSFSVATANGSATAGSDYVALPLTNEVIPAGQPSKTFTVTINGDATVEANEVFNVDGYTPVNATFADSHALGTILSDELPTLSIADVSITEGNSGTKLMTFTATLSQAVTGAVSFGVATANGSATAGSDYVAVPLTNKSIPTGQTSRTFTVTINGDAAVEANEVFNVNGFSPVNATFARSHALGTITSDELPTLSIADVSITEGNSGTKLMTFTATLSQAVTAAVSFGVATANGSATGGSDYVTLPLTNKSIATGQTSKTFTVTINGDTTVEGNEVFNVNGFSPVNATFADSHALGTITNDD